MTPAEAAVAEAPVLLGAGDAADPHVVRVGSDYFLYTTMRGWTTVPVWRSSDHATWTFAGDALPVLPGWADWGYAWAPGVVEVDGRFVLFFTTRDAGSGRQVIGVADATRPEGPFSPRGDGPIVADVAAGGSIDAYPFRDADGALYLYWKVDANSVGSPTSLWGARLRADGLALASTPVRLLVEDAAWEHPTVENPAMVLGADGHLLFYSGGWWESPDYGIGVASCAGPLGPCTKRTVAGAWETRRWAYVGIGGGAFFTDERGAVHLAAHAWTYPSVGYDRGGLRRLLVAAVGLGASPVWYLAPDLDPTDVHAPSVERALELGLVRGAPDGRFDPLRTVSRGQAATMLRNLLTVLGTPVPAGPDAFADDDGSVHEPALDALAAAGILSGVGDRRAAPDQPVSRGQLASLLAATLGHARGEPLPAGPDAFADDGASAHAVAIDALAADGVVRGVGPGTFAPELALTRAQAATFVVAAAA